MTITALVFALAACGTRNDETSAPDEPSSPGGEVEPEPTPEPEEQAGRVNPGTGACTTDADCVPASCCHPDACVARAQAPDCSDTMCTTDCRYGTMDCGGGCFCQQGTCAARLSEAPNIEVH
jgi:hypothetical protein